MTALLSIIVPCYKCAKDLDNSVVPILQLDKHQNLQIVLIDDASPDNTLQKCMELSRAYPQVKVISLANNLGQANARNAGLQAANGKYIGFLDADDTVTADYCKTIFSTIKKQPNADIIVWGCNEQHYDKRGKLVKNVEILPKKGTYTNSIELAIQLEKQTLLGYLWNKVYKADLIFNNNLSIPKEHLIEDILFNVNAFKCSKEIYCIEKSLYYYKRHIDKKDSVTTKNLPDYFDQNYKRIQTLYNWTKNKDILATIYCRYAMSAIWRNNNSNMSLKDQAKWINDFYELDLSKTLLPYAKPQDKIAKIYTSKLQSHSTYPLIFIASQINFVTNNMSGLLIKLRQSR